MKNLSSGFTIPWEDFNQALRGEQIFHAQYCPDNKAVCLGVWLDRWCYCDRYVVAKHGHRKDNTIIIQHAPQAHEFKQQLRHSLQRETMKANFKQA